MSEHPEARERKLVTVLFADVSGSVGLGEKLDPEGFRDVMGAFFQTARGAIEAFGGTVEKFIGDAVMAVFGVPSAHDDDPVRALGAARSVLDRLGELNQRIEATHGVTLAARIGINTGEVIASQVSSPEVGQVSGDAVNVAARLEQAAEPGQILVAERTVRACRSYRFRDLGLSRIRGREAPIRVFELLGPAGPAQLGAQLLHAPLVGRESELRLLATLLERTVREQQPHLVTVYGSAGIGKSRLTAEFLELAHRQEPAPIILKGRCRAYGEETTYRPMTEILKGHAGILDTDPPDLTLQKIRKMGEGLFAGGPVEEPERVAAALGFTAGIEDPDHPFRELSPRQIEEEIQNAWRCFFTSLARENPVVAEIEDIHWADAAMLNLIEYLAERVLGPVLFVCAARPELTDFAPSWGGGKRNFSSIPLEPLTDEEADRLVSLLLEVDEMPAEARREILRRAEGNPFFIEEILRQLIDECCIVRAGDRWQATDLIERVHIPDTVQAVLAARIDLLGPDEKRALQCAAVVGRIFWTGAVASLLDGQREEVTGLLEVLEDRDLVVSHLGSALQGEREYSFRHVLTRDVAFDSLSLRERTTLHWRAAAWVERTSGDRWPEVVEVIAYHQAEAYRGMKSDPTVGSEQLEDIRRRAFEFLVRASDAALVKLALETAKRFAEEAEDCSAGPAERARALEALGEAHFSGYEGDEAWACLRRAIDLHLEVDDLTGSELARLCARALETPVRWPGAMQSVPVEADVDHYMKIGFGAAAEGDNPELVRLLTLKAFWPHAFSRPPERADESLVSPAESLRAGEEAVNMARRLGRADLESAALDGVGANHIPLGRYDLALEVTNRRLSLSTQIDDPWEVGDMHAMGGWVNFHLGRYRDALASAEAGIARTLDRVPSVGLHNIAWRAVARYRLGDFQGVLEDLAIGTEMLGERRDEPPPFVCPMYGAAALVMEIRGDTAGADHIIAILAHLDEDAAPRDRDTITLGRWASFLAPLLARRGRGDEARLLLTETTWRRGARTGLLLQAECEVAAEAGAWQDHHEVVARARAEDRRVGLKALRYAADLLEGRAALAAGAGDRAVEFLTAAGTGFAELGARWDRAVTELALAEALNLVGRSDDATRALGSAAAVFSELGAVREDARAADLASGRTGHST